MSALLCIVTVVAKRLNSSRPQPVRWLTCPAALRVLNASSRGFRNRRTTIASSAYEADIKARSVSSWSSASRL